MTTPLIAVTGATGQLGGRLAFRLAAAGAAQRLIVRDPARAPELAGASVAVAQGYTDGAGMRSALEGADTLFLVSGRESADRVAEHRSAIDAAVHAGVSRIVYVSFLGAGPKATFTFARDHWATEEYIRSTGLRFTFLRDNLYFAMMPHLVGADGVIRGPAGDGRAAAVAHDDIADVATAVLLDEREHVHDGATYDVTGPEALSMTEFAAHLTRATGRQITYVPETIPEAYASRADYDAPLFEVDGWVTSYTAIAAGDLAAVSPTVRILTNREPESFATWLDLNPQEWAHLRR
ncbi:SDR family oxidoreductase [Pengzhenrongella frigida]|uniref:SDR family oxidoreductase n=1 Tax=Pengzhenrongella frigida TaxID=1259133 RepID=A0A4V1ZHF4_9MICO|nr:SDR family oxidoreductase [Cellulomonas sp. HLT2-17]RYV51854.1 SDR family oxidoreductase [Cellulomonas sp. HLT2-17]